MLIALTAINGEIPLEENVIKRNIKWPIHIAGLNKGVTPWAMDWGMKDWSHLSLWWGLSPQEGPLNPDRFLHSEIKILLPVFSVKKGKYLIL